jgi:hypothetical protein
MLLRYGYFQLSITLMHVIMHVTWSRDKYYLLCVSGSTAVQTDGFIATMLRD